MSEQAVFILSNQTLNKVVQQIKDDQWDMTMPPEFNRRGQGEVTLREIINYHAYDDAWVPDILAGESMEEVGKDKFDGDLLGDDPKASFAAINDKANAAAKALTDLDEVTHLSYGDFPAREYLWHISFFRTTRAYDIAKVIGVDPTLPEALCVGMYEILKPHEDEWRQMGLFGPAIPVSDDASPQAKLLALTGRQPE